MGREGSGGLRSKRERGKKEGGREQEGARERPPEKKKKKKGCDDNNNDVRMMMDNLNEERRLRFAQSIDAPVLLNFQLLANRRPAWDCPGAA